MPGTAWASAEFALPRQATHHWVKLFMESMESGLPEPLEECPLPPAPLPPLRGTAPGGVPLMEGTPHTTPLWIFHHAVVRESLCYGEGISPDLSLGAPQGWVYGVFMEQTLHTAPSVGSPRDWVC
ncbi:hypothetical protein Tter_0518 [Thermobaculum terrenum ATCC BAA-798]|uniref:Uncharacterized protein n=1 Tax=Thermobaculum terrenum (strain ATCC BAA-798 / CCMEE 7001 / YNP1) TaxID=525904 RepID=D1CET2_THET1|nr:hypothetical protein Tter_0518 [Thermobaculum terrenum ATCC BAA-798]